MDDSCIEFKSYGVKRIYKLSNGIIQKSESDALRLAVFMRLNRVHSQSLFTIEGADEITA